MPILTHLFCKAERAYEKGLKNPKLIDGAVAVCGKYLRKILNSLKNNKLSSTETLRYKSASLQIKTFQKELSNQKKFGFGHVVRNQKPSDRVKWVDEESAFATRIRSGVIHNMKHKDSLKFLDDCAILFKRYVKDVLKQYISIKVNAVFCGEFVRKKAEQQIFDVKYLNTRNYPIYRDTDLSEWFSNHIQASVLKKLEEFQERDSGWALARIINLKVNINKFSLLHASSYVDLPKEIKVKHACVNVKNFDEACFAWAVTSAVYPAEHNSDRISSYPHYSKVLKLKGIQFPMTVKQVPCFEMLNQISINIYIIQKLGKNSFDIVPVYLTKQKQNKHVNLLMVQNEYYYDNDYNCLQKSKKDDCDYNIKYHFVWIKSLSRLLSTQLSKHDHKKFLCDRCFNYFYSEEKLNLHTEDCKNLNHCKIRVPEREQKIVAFKNFKNKEKVPFVIYADLESVLKPVNDKNKYQEHVPAAIGFYVKCSYDDSLSYFKSYRGEDCIDWFTQELKQFAENVERVFLCPYDMDPLTSLQELSFQKATHCHICNEPFRETDKKVRDHFHLTSGNNNNGDKTSNYRGAAHDKCNIVFQDSHKIPVIFHNLSGYDANFIIKSIALGIEGRMSLLPITKEKFISFTKHVENSCVQFKFIDSFKFMSSSLEKLVDNISSKQLNILRSYFPDPERFDLICQKGIYPYDYITSFDTFLENQLPSIDAFYNKLDENKCSMRNYSHAKLVWDKFNIHNLGEYTDLYLKCDILLLADVFENFRISCLNTYELDPAHYYTLPGYTWDCMLKYTKVNIELLDNIEKILFIEKGIRGGLSQCSKRCSRANNKYIPQFDSSKSEVYIMYWDVNNQYGWGMSNHLPYGDFEWVENTNIKDINVLSIADDAEDGYIFEVDLDYPEYLHDIHRDLPFCPEHFSAPGSRDKKLMATLLNKRKYVIHYRALKQAIMNGLKLTKIHRVLQFKQSAWLKPYIDLNTELRKNAKNAFEKDLFKLMNNAIFGKTIENIRKHSTVKLVSQWDGRYGAEAYLSNPRFKSFTIFDENLIAIELNKVEIYFNKAIYIGMSILDISRTSLYEYHYKYMLEVYGRNCSILYTDTDSLIYEIRNQNPYELIKRDCDKYYDTSDYAENNVYCIPRVNKKKIGLMSDENAGRIVTDFVRLSAKLYTIKLLSDVRGLKRKREELAEKGYEDEVEMTLLSESLIKKAKGVKKCVVNTHISFDDYVSCLDSFQDKVIVQNLIKSEKFHVNSITQTKLALSPYDTKRYLTKNSYDTLPWGHYSIINK